MPKKAFEKFGALCGPFYPDPSNLSRMAECTLHSTHSPPTLTAEQVTKHYRDHESAIKAAAGRINHSLPQIPWIFCVANLIRSNVENSGALLKKCDLYAQLICPAFYTGVFFDTAGATLWAIAAYRTRSTDRVDLSS